MCTYFLDGDIMRGILNVSHYDKNESFVNVVLLWGGMVGVVEVEMILPLINMGSH